MAIRALAVTISPIVYDECSIFVVRILSKIERLDDLIIIKNFVIFTPHLGYFKARKIFLLTLSRSSIYLSGSDFGNAVAIHCGLRQTAIIRIMRVFSMRYSEKMSERH